MMSFDQASKLFKQEKVNELAADPDGLRFLKLRSLSRKESIAKLFDLAGISPSRTAATQMFREAYETKIDEKVIEAAIRRIYEEGRTFRRTQEPALVSELYKLTAFDWGGLHQNSLEKTIVDNYVKKITNFDTLCDKIENDLHNSMRGYVLCSWYNHWTQLSSRMYLGTTQMYCPLWAR